MTLQRARAGTSGSDGSPEPCRDITMTVRKADLLKSIQTVVDRMLRVGQAAQRLATSRRQIGLLVAAT
jgi:hypothetical protein